MSVDHVSARLYPSDAPTSLQPFKVYGDGNCLARAASVLAYGDETHHVEMRARICIELASNVEFYLGYGDAEQPAFVARVSSHYEGQEKGPWIREVFEKDVFEVTKLGTYMGLWQLYAMAAIVGQPLHSIYPDFAAFSIRPRVHGLIVPRRASGSAPSPAGIMWTHTAGRSSRSMAWAPNHFVVGLLATTTAMLKQVKPGDFVLVGVPSRKGQTSNYVAQVSLVNKDGLWGRYLVKVGDKWGWPGTVPMTYFIPREDVVKLLGKYTISTDRRQNVLYSF